MKESFKAIIERDISRCTDALEHGDKHVWHSLYVELKSVYGPIIDGFCDNLYGVYYDTSGTGAKYNVEIMKQKLELFRAMDYENKYADRPAEVTYHNTNQVVTTINVTFEDAKEKVESMSALKDEEVEEILSKINELEKITQSSNRKTKKWEMAKDIIKWVADKGIDVAKIILPLVLKVGE